MVTRTDIRDAGFSLAELMVVVALMGIMITLSYGAFVAVDRASEVSSRQATFAREISRPLAIISEAVMQGRIEAADDYSLTITTDVDNNDLLERHVIAAPGTGTRLGTLTMQSWLTDSSRVNTTQRMNATFSRNLVNRAVSEPLFRYYGTDASGTEYRITTMADVPSAATSVEIVIVVEDADGNQFTDSRRMSLRNQ